MLKAEREMETFELWRRDNNNKNAHTSDTLIIIIIVIRLIVVLWMGIHKRQVDPTRP